MRVKALVWLGIPVDDYARAGTFFAETLGLDVAFDEPHTMELSAANDDRIQLFGRDTAISSSSAAAEPRLFPCLRWTTSTKPGPS